jgi:hypothetical protein
MDTMHQMTPEVNAAYRTGFLAGLSCGNPLPSDPECPAEIDDRVPYTAAEAQWASETCPLDGGWVDGKPTPFDLELLTVSALEFFNDHLDLALDQAAAESEAQDRIELGIPF